MITLKPLNIQRWTSAEDGRASTEQADCRQQARRTLLVRVALLPEADRLLLELVYADALPIRRVARVVGREPGWVSRRARQLVRRVYSSFITRVMEAGEQLTDIERAVALRRFVSRQGAREVARALGISIGEVRRAGAFVLGWYRGATGRSAS